MKEQTVSEVKVHILPASQSTLLDVIARRGSSSLAWRCFGFEHTDVAQKMATKNN